jgi:nitrogen fixation protein FixH
MTTGRAWAMGLAAFFATVIAMNAIFVGLALSGADPVAPSYRTEHR